MPGAVEGILPAGGAAQEDAEVLELVLLLPLLLLLAALASSRSYPK